MKQHVYCSKFTKNRRKDARETSFDITKNSLAYLLLRLFCLTFYAFRKQPLISNKNRGVPNYTIPSDSRLGPDRVIMFKKGICRIPLTTKPCLCHLIPVDVYNLKLALQVIQTSHSVGLGLSSEQYTLSRLLYKANNQQRHWRWYQMLKKVMTANIMAWKYVT